MLRQAFLFIPVKHHGSATLVSCTRQIQLCSDPLLEGKVLCMKLKSRPVCNRFIWWCFQFFQFSLKCVWRLVANRAMAQHFSEFRHNKHFALIQRWHSEFGKNGEPYFQDLSTLLGWVSSWFRAYNRLPDVSRSVFVQPLTSLNSCPVQKRFF